VSDLSVPPALRGPVPETVGLVGGMDRRHADASLALDHTAEVMARHMLRRVAGVLSALETHQEDQ